MDTDTRALDSTQAVEGRIVALLHQLPPENLTVVEQFVRFIQEQAAKGQPVVAQTAREEHPPYKYPTVEVPASVLLELDSIMPPIGGDALADTEALYDDV